MSVITKKFLMEVANVINESEAIPYYEARCEAVVKPNIEKFGIILSAVDSKGSCVCPVVYFDTFKGENVSDAVDYVKKVFEQSFDKTLELGNCDISSFIKGHIHEVRMGVVNASNTEFMKKYAGRQIWDLYFFYYIILEEGKGGISTVKLTPSLLDMFGIDEDALYNLAKENISKDCVHINMNDLLPPELSMLLPDDQPYMEVVSNKNHMYGAAQILNKELLAKIAKKRGCDLVILPSSMNEVIITEKSYLEGADISSMIGSVNSECVNADEVLSDHPYFYHKETGFISC